MNNEQEIIRQTRNWVEKVVVGLNFCPFAHREVENNRLRYIVSPALNIEAALEDLAKEFHFLDEQEETETSLLILPLAFDDFDDYLDLVDLAEALVEDMGYEGTYQVASFHPNYLFSDSCNNMRQFVSANMWMCFVGNAFIGTKINQCA